MDVLKRIWKEKTDWKVVVYFAIGTVAIYLASVAVFGHRVITITF